jgi:RNA 3'-terminal phosphate cyclase
VTALAAGTAVVATLVIFGQHVQEEGTEINGWYPLGGGMFVFAVIPWCLSLPFRGRKRVIARTVLTCVFAAALPPVAHWLGFLPIGTP